MKLGIAGYIATQDIAHWLDADPARLPKGFPGAPLFRTFTQMMLERGHEISLFTVSEDVPADAPAPIVARGERVRIYYAPYRKHSLRPNPPNAGRLVDFFKLERRMLVRAMQEDRPDLVHAHWTYELAMAAIDSGLPYVVTSHDSPLKVLKHFRNIYRLGRYFMARSVLGRASTITAVSPYLRDEIQRYARVPISIVPNALAPEMLERESRGARAIDPAAPKLAMVLNGWIELKNPKGGLLAFRRIRERHPGAVLEVYGAGYEPDGPAAAWARENGVDAGVVFNGPVPHGRLIDALDRLDILFHPSLEEAGSMIVTEAMSLGLPVIGGATSGAMPWITGGDAGGVMTDVRDPQALAAAACSLIEDPARYAARVAGAMARAREIFSTDGVARQYEAVYETVLAAAARQAPAGRQLERTPNAATRSVP